MNLRKYMLLFGTFLLSGCSLGAQPMNKNTFKTLLEKEVKPTLKTSLRNVAVSLAYNSGDRHINAKTLVEDKYEYNTSKLADFKDLKALESGVSLSAKHTTTNYVTKEIINSAGLKVYSDVEKVINIDEFVVSNDARNKKVTFSRVEEEETIKSDYISIELDPLTSRIIKAEILLDDDIHGIGGEKAVYNTFKEKSDSEEEGEVEPVSEITLDNTEWTLSDSTKKAPTAVLTIVAGVDKIVSKTVSVGTIAFDKDHVYPLYMFEKEEASYNLEIRHTDKVENDTNIEEATYANKADLDAQVKTLINNFFNHAKVKEMEGVLLDKYQEAYDYIKNTIDVKEKIEILERQTGIVYRIVDGSMYHETLLNKNNETTNMRSILDIVEREGTNGDHIVYTNFTGYDVTY